MNEDYVARLNAHERYLFQYSHRGGWKYTDDDFYAADAAWDVALHYLHYLFTEDNDDGV